MTEVLAEAMPANSTSELETKGYSYDEVPYPSVPFEQSHPNRLATVAALHGLQPPEVARCRVLELACAQGDNLLPLALELPQAELVGLDLSARQIDEARTAAAELGVGNVRFEQRDILDLPADLGSFDFIIAHGVYSWVPAPVQDGILAACKSQLKPNGVAYVSYNTYPGWRLKSVIRDLMLYHTRHMDAAEAKIDQSVAIVRFIHDAIPQGWALYRKVFEDLLDKMQRDKARAPWLFHEYLEEVNEPVYFSQFAEQAASHGLKFFSEAGVTDDRRYQLPPQAQEALAKLGDDVVEREQYLDFLTNRTFRQSLLCHAEAVCQPGLDPASIKSMSLVADLNCEAPETESGLRSRELMRFRGSNGLEAAADNPLTKAALLILADAWPRDIPFVELEAMARARLVPKSVVIQEQAAYREDSRELLQDLCGLYTSGFLELHLAPPRFASEPGERPLASPWARRQAARGALITNLRHRGVEADEIRRRLLTLLDGTRTHEDLLEDLVERVESDGLVVQHEGRPVSDTIQLRELLAGSLREELATAARFALLLA